MQVKMLVNSILVLLDVYQTYSQHKYHNLFVTIQYPNLHHEKPLFKKQTKQDKIFRKKENLTLTIFGLVKTLLRIFNSSRKAIVSIRKSSVRDDICIKHVKP
jgi:hypothetical protein